MYNIYKSSNLVSIIKVKTFVLPTCLLPRGLWPVNIYLCENCQSASGKNGWDRVMKRVSLSAEEKLNDSKYLNWRTQEDNKSPAMNMTVHKIIQVECRKTCQGKSEIAVSPQNVELSEDVY